MSATRAIDSIIIGERYPRDMGDIHGLAASIAVGRSSASGCRHSER